MSFGYRYAEPHDLFPVFIIQFIMFIITFSFIHQKQMKKIKLLLTDKTSGLAANNEPAVERNRFHHNPMNLS
jgi:hypothetical protein